jgi:hypothetical protein
MNKKKTARTLRETSKKKQPRRQFFDKNLTVHVRSEWVKEGEYHPNSYSGFVRDAILAYNNNRHQFKFREILEAISGELLILTAWKEKGHPGGAKWTEKEDQQLEYYERCFEILMNSPFAGKL